MKGWPLAALAALLVGHPSQASPPLSWVLVYWMAYDNNLSPLAEPILEMIAEGVQGPGVAVTVLIDREGPGGLERVVITQAGSTHTPLPDEEGSAEVDLLSRELDLVRRTLPAEHYGVVFLDHGGGLSEMSADGHGGADWLDPRQVAPVLEQFRSQATGELELLFLQQCGKGSLETFHLFRDSARTLVASEAVIGAPNFYYQEALTALSLDPARGGERLASSMVNGDRPDMYATYTVLDATVLELLPERLDQVLAPLLAVEGPLMWSGSPAPVFAYGSERYHDLLGLLSQLYVDNALAPEPLHAFQSWWREDALAELVISPTRRGRRAAHSGASVMVPRTPEALEALADLPLYQQSRLDELVGKLAQR